MKFKVRIPLQYVKPVCIAAVLVGIFAVAAGSWITGLCLLLGIPMEEMGGQLPVMLLALNAVFVLYDCCFTRVMRTVMRRYRKLFLND